MATTTQHIATRSDPQLLERLIAAAEMQDIPNAAQWVQQNMGMLISTPIDEQGQTIADVYAYAKEVRDGLVKDLPPLPGLNPGAVTDENMRVAINVLITPSTPPSN